MEAKGVVVITLVLSLAAAAGAARPKETTMGLTRRGLASEPMTHLHFYFHDKVSKPSPTSVRVVDSVDSESLFGSLYVMDDALTEGPEPESQPVGWAQGMYMSTGLAKLGLLQVMNLVVVTVLGRNGPFGNVREMPVIGGTGTFRFSRGYAQLKTHTLDLKKNDAIVEYNVYIMH
uniref:Dirigent protein n=1 Tax=Oryza barthii TaxID=65489 RepID=A0A0D3HLN5_9ORYZ